MEVSIGYLPDWVSFRINHDSKKCSAYGPNIKELGRMYKKIGLKIDESRFIRGLQESWMEELYTVLPKGL